MSICFAADDWSTAPAHHPPRQCLLCQPPFPPPGSAVLQGPVAGEPRLGVFSVLHRRRGELPQERVHDGHEEPRQTRQQQALKKKAAPAVWHQCLKSFSLFLGLSVVIIRLSARKKTPKRVRSAATKKQNNPEVFNCIFVSFLLISFPIWKNRSPCSFVLASCMERNHVVCLLCKNSCWCFAGALIRGVRTR